VAGVRQDAADLEPAEVAAPLVDDEFNHDLPPPRSGGRGTARRRASGGGGGRPVVRFDHPELP
jgi:hypothetical protein